jgi:hypothetical protein
MLQPRSETMSPEHVVAEIKELTQRHHLAEGKQNEN